MEKITKTLEKYLETYFKVKEGDKAKVLAAIAIVAIAISWFIMGSILERKNTNTGEELLSQEYVEMEEVIKEYKELNEKK